jgi:protein-S-isoprenylcysteine O-methyltransferase Ste14
MAAVLVCQPARPPDRAGVYHGQLRAGAWALIENRYFSGVVRLQTDRGHQVVSSGPYRFTRTPVTPVR